MPPHKLRDIASTIKLDDASQCFIQPVRSWHQCALVLQKDCNATCMLLPLRGHISMRSCHRTFQIRKQYLHDVTPVLLCKKTTYGIKPNKSGGGDNNTIITFNHHADALFYNSLLFFLPPVFCKGCIRKVLQGERKEQHKRQGFFGEESTIPAAHA